MRSIQQRSTATQAGLGPVDRLVTLGSPHNPPPVGVADQTRGILNHVAATTPGNFHEQVAPARDAWWDPSNNASGMQGGEMHA